ncbi:hypothetical protein G3570_05360 [Balneolaceae bacterium YR4-1]|uniref:Uncharacterized protein n=1 Tax=Halalkalibaculum roseum TaxID=2709311 RepID=A0A6M1SZS6_9BACT|nr:hypothetical protein [Halalkalibaculum roseum]NGP76047.1 hypothetical protein [Halalkalibaculum roseum]
MKLFNKFSTNTLLITLAVLLITATACNNPASSEEEEHPEPAGVLLKMNGQEIARYEDNSVTGQIEVNAGEETTLIRLFFLDDSGNEFQPDEPELSLQWRDINTAIADVEQHSEDGKWAFHIHGEAQGNTSVVFQLLHDGHSDFDTQPIPVVVN